MFHGVGLLFCSCSEPTSKTRNLFRCLGSIPWMGDRSIARPQNTQDSTTQTLKYIDAWSGIRTHDPSFRAVQDHKRIIPRGKWNG